MAGKPLKTAGEIKTWILQEVRRGKGCENFDHRFEVTPANSPHDGTWEYRPSPPASNPCTTVFAQKAHHAQSAFDLRL